MKGRVWMIKIYAMQLGSPFPSSTVHFSDGWFPFIFGDVFWKGGSEWLNICNGAWQRQMKSVVPMAMRLTQLKGPSYLGQLCDELSTSQLTTGATRYISAELFWPLTCTGSCTIHSPLRMDSFFSADLVFQCQDRPKENLKFFWVMLSGHPHCPLSARKGADVHAITGGTDYQMISIKNCYRHTGGTEWPFRCLYFLCVMEYQVF